jgi:uncharacterized protein YhaN
VRLKRLYLKAFGPFTDQTLDFDSPGPGLHIVYGLNEAGKSSSLRGLKALLYGFDERTADNFVHRNPDLLVGGIIEGTGGEELEFYRRKKRLADLFDTENNPLDGRQLGRLMPSIGVEVFTSLYGIDHKMLVAGGEEILAQRGEVGQALFAAGSGITALRKVVDELKAEAEDLFKSRGSKQLINQAVASYQQQKRMAREESLLPRKYQELEKKKREAEVERQSLEQESFRVSGDIERLSRLQRIIPELAELENLQKQLDDLGTAPPLSPGFDDRVKLIEQEIVSISKQVRRDKERLNALQISNDAILPNRIILDHGSVVEDLYQRLDRYRKDGQDRIKLEGERTAQRRDAGLLIESIDPGLSLEDGDALRLVQGKSRTILNQRLKQAGSALEKLENETDQTQDELSELPLLKNTEKLSLSIKKARSAGDIDEQIDTLCEEVKTAEKNCLTDLKRAGLWKGELHELQQISFPLPATVRSFEAEFLDMEKRRERIEREHRRVADELKKAGADRRDLLKGETLPSESDLQEVRQKRQQGWQLIKRAWLDGEELDPLGQEIKAYDSDRDLPEAYERQVEAADRVADRLRDEAERTALAASLTLKMENLHLAQKETEERRREIEQAADQLTARWLKIWNEVKIAPLSPAEMREWLDQVDKLRFRMTDISSRVQEQKAKTRSRESLRRLLAETLTEVDRRITLEGNRLAPLLQEAELALAEIEQHNQRRRTLTEKNQNLMTERARCLEELRQAEGDLVDWQLDWEKALISLKLKRHVSVDEAVDLLKTIDECLNKLENARGFQSRIEGIDRDMARFENDLQEMVETAAADLREASPEQAVLKLYDLLGQAKEAEQQRSQGLATMSELTSDLRSAEKQLVEFNDQMVALLREAGCHNPAELAETMARSRKTQALFERISAKQASIANLSEGVDLEKIKEQAAEVDIDTLPGQLASLRRRVEEEFAPRISAATELIGAEDRELKLMDGQSKAAEAAEQMQQEAALIGRLTDRYVKISLASLIVKREIERYRKAHQGPILKKATEIFKGLTLGAFSELRADIDDQGLPILTAVKGSGTSIGVESMSDGTRDQLYLALRLASLHVRLAEDEPMPFIVDDILVNFDDRRSRAALEALDELAKDNQVILFTHHQQIVDQAETLGSAAGIVIHRLQA